MTETASREPFRTLLDGQVPPRVITVARATPAGLGELTPEMLEDLERNVANRIAYSDSSGVALANASSRVEIRKGATGKVLPCATQESIVDRSLSRTEDSERILDIPPGADWLPPGVRRLVPPRDGGAE